MERTAKRATKPVASVRATGLSLTTRRNTLRPTHSPGSSISETPSTTAMFPPQTSGTKSTDSGRLRPSTTSATTSGTSFTCNCGKSYLSKATLARHKKDCGTRDTGACQFCGARFPTFAGVRQHERLKHPELYQRELEAKLPAPDSVLLAQIADIEASSTTGIFYGAMVAATGLSKNQVRYRRERPEYQTYLARAKKRLASVTPSQPSQPRPPQSRSSRYERRTQERELAPRAPVGTDESPRTPDRPPDHNLAANNTPAAALPDVQTSSRSDHVTTPSPDGKVLATEDAPPLMNLAATTSNPAMTDIVSLSPVQDTSLDLGLPLNRSKHRRLSCSLPSLLPAAVEREDPPGQIQVLGPIKDLLVQTLDDPPDTVRNNFSVLVAVRSALNESEDQVLQNVDLWLEDFQQGRNNGRKRRPASKPGPAHYGQTNTGRGSRASTFKRAQDLFSKNRKGLAEAVLDGKDLERGGETPEMEALTDLFAGIFERESPPDLHPFHPTDLGTEHTPIPPITPEDVVAAKNGWRVSSAGADGIPVQTVKNRDDVELSILFNVILFRNVQPTTWRLLRTTLVPKEGNRRDPTNWRPISVGSAVQRLLHRVLVSRLKRSLPFSNHQRGFVEIDGTLANALILHQYIQSRSDLRKGYNVVSLDIRKAFDTVSHNSILRAMKRFGVPDELRHYIMSTFDATTTLNIPGNCSRPINIRSGVRQGDPISPLLFNAVMDELLVRLNEEFSGGSLPNGARCAAMAFADDLIIMADEELDIPIMLDEVYTFLQQRGMEVNPAKCRSLAARACAGRSVPRSGSLFKINNSPIPVVPGLNVFRYLGHDFGHQGMNKPGLFRLPEWLTNISKAPLKPDQKLILIKSYLLPRLLYSLQNPKTTSRSLRDADRLIRKAVRKTLHLNAHTPDSCIHAKVRDGGLGVMELRTSIPRIFLSRLAGLLEHTSDSAVLAVLQSDTTRSLMSRLQVMAGDIPGPTRWREKIASGVLTRGLEQAYEDPSSRDWVDAKPTGWSGRDFVRAVQLRTANLPTKAIPSNPVGQRRCRGGCPGDENISHVLQTCPVTHWERIRRHNEIVAKLSRHCRSKRWEVEEEPHVRHHGGQLFKPDLVIHQPGDTTVVADVQVAWDANDLGVAYDRKRVVYDNVTFREAAAKRWPGKALVFAPIIVGARGIWPRVNNERSAVLAIPPMVRRSCVRSALKWGSSIHTAFMKAVWRKTRAPASVQPPLSFDPP